MINHSNTTKSSNYKSTSQIIHMCIKFLPEKLEKAHKSPYVQKHQKHTHLHIYLM